MNGPTVERPERMAFSLARTEDLDPELEAAGVVAVRFSKDGRSCYTEDGAGTLRRLKDPEMVRAYRAKWRAWQLEKDLKAKVAARTAELTASTDSGPARTVMKLTPEFVRVLTKPTNPVEDASVEG